jgi:hypothetical protein
MNIRRFKNSFLSFFFLSALLVAWLADHSASHYQQRMTLLVAILLVLLSAVLAVLMSMPEQRDEQEPVTTPEQRKNAAMFRHQPAAANFRVRMAHNEQVRRRSNVRKYYTVNPDHTAFNSK